MAPGQGWVPVVCIGTGLFVLGASHTMWNVQSVTLRQAITPTHQLGRVNAAPRAVAYGCAAIGALLGGVLSGPVGLRTVILLAAAVSAAAATLINCASVRAVRDLK